MIGSEIVDLLYKLCSHHCKKGVELQCLIQQVVTINNIYFIVHNLMLSICCYSGSESPKLQSKFHFVRDHLTERRDVRSIVRKSLSLFRFYLFISVKINVLVHYVLILCLCCQCHSQLAVDFLFCLVLIEVLKQVNK